MLVITDGLPRGLGYLERRDPHGTGPRLFEADTYTCTHCSRVVVMNPQRVRERYKCRGCNHHICDDCAALRAAGGPCKTIHQLADELMEQAAKAPPDPAPLLQSQGPSGPSFIPPAVWP